MDHAAGLTWAWVQISGLPPASWVTWGKLLALSEPQFPLLLYEHKDSNCLIEAECCENAMRSCVQAAEHHTSHLIMLGEHWMLYPPSVQRQCL